MERIQSYRAEEFFNHQKIDKKYSLENDQLIMDGERLRTSISDGWSSVEKHFRKQIPPRPHRMRVVTADCREGIAVGMESMRLSHSVRVVITHKKPLKIAR